MKKYLIGLIVILFFLSSCATEQNPIPQSENQPESQGEQSIQISEPESSLESPPLEKESAISAEPPMVYDGENFFTYYEKYEAVYMEPSNTPVAANAKGIPFSAIKNKNIYVMWDFNKIVVQEGEATKELNLYDFVRGNLPPMDNEIERYQFIFLDSRWFYQNDTHLYLIFQVGGEADYVATHAVCINLETKEFEEFLLDAPGIYILDISLENNNIYLYGKTFLEPLYVYVIDTENIKLIYENTYEFDGSVTDAEANGSTATVTVDYGESPDETVAIEF